MTTIAYAAVVPPQPMYTVKLAIMHMCSTTRSTSTYQRRILKSIAVGLIQSLAKLSTSRGRLPWPLDHWPWYHGTMVQCASEVNLEIVGPSPHPLWSFFALSQHRKTLSLRLPRGADLEVRYWGYHVARAADRIQAISGWTESPSQLGAAFADVTALNSALQTFKYFFVGWWKLRCWLRASFGWSCKCGIQDISGRT